MKIVFGDSFKNTCNKEWGIRPSHVRDAINNKDQMETLTVSTSLEFIFFTKRVTLSNVNLYLLVWTHVRGDELQVYSAYKVRPDLASNLDALTPLEMLEKLAQRFGMEFTMGETTTRFVLRKQIPLIGTSQVSVNRFKGHDFIQEFTMKIVKGPIPFADCLLCFCLDTTLYEEWIRR